MSKVNIDLLINTANSAKSLKETKQAIKDLKDAALQVGEGTEEFNRLTQAAGKLTDKVGDVNQRIKVLSGDTQKLQGAIGVVQGLAGAFGAVQGAAALFGTEGKKLQETMVKLQATMTLLNSLQQVANVLNKDSSASIFLKTTAQKGYNLVVGQSIGALKGFRIALAATGIGAIAILVGALYANWDKLTAAVKENSEGFQKFKQVLMFVAPPIYAIIKGVELVSEKFGGFRQLLGGITEAVKQFASNIGDVFSALFSGDIKGVIAAAKNIGNDVGKAFNEGVKQSQAEIDEEMRIERVKAEIETQERLLKVRQAAGENTLELEREILNKKQSIHKQGTDEYKQAELDLMVFDAKVAADKRKKLEEEAKKRKEYLSKIDKDLTDAKIRNIEDDIKREKAVLQLAFEEKLTQIKGNSEQEIALREQLQIELNKRLNEIDERGKKEKVDKEYQEQLLKNENDLKQLKVNKSLNIEAELFLENERFELLKNNKELTDEELRRLELEHQEKTLEIQNRYNAEKLANEIALKDARLATAHAYAEGIGHIGTILASDAKTAADFQKASAIFSIGIDTAEALSALMAHSEKNPLNAVTMGGAGIAQYAIGVARILGNIAKAKQLLTQEAPQAPQFARGGFVKGAGTGTSDSITAKLSNGESVINAKSTAMFAPLLSKINEAGGGVPIVKKYSNGGLVTNNIDTSGIESAISGIGNIQVTANVVESEMTSSQRRVSRIQKRSKF
jgi:hypothetical protein